MFILYMLIYLPLTSSPPFRSSLRLVPGPSVMHSAMATTSFSSISIGCGPVLASQILLSWSTSTTPCTGHSPNGPGPVITVPPGLGVGTATRTCVMVCGASVADPKAGTAKVIAHTSVTDRMVHGRRCPMCSSSGFERVGRCTAPSHGRTVSYCSSSQGHGESRSAKALKRSSLH